MNSQNDYILQFVNSRDIRKYLGEIGYTFSALEAAWLIWQCRKASLMEKHRAWNRVIREYPDCAIEERQNTEPQESLHRFLREYMSVENRLLERFHDPAGVVYLASKKDRNRMWDPLPQVVASSFDPKDLKFHLEEGDRIMCWRRELDAPDNREISVLLNRKCEILEIDTRRLKEYPYRDMIFRGVFPGLWFDFPTPFKKGDILWDPTNFSPRTGGPFVLEAVNLDRLEDNEKYIEWRRKNGDISDMDYQGIYVLSEMNLFKDQNWNYMDIEYYPHKPEGAYKLLTPAAALLKGEIDECLFARAYKTIMLEVETDRMFPNEYTKESLELAGIRLMERKGSITDTEWR